MKQLILVGVGALATAPATLSAMSSANKLAAGLLAFYDSTGNIITTANAKNVNKRTYISLFVGATEATELMQSVAMVDIKTLSYVKSAYVAGSYFAANVTIPVPVEGRDYTIVLAKKGTQWNERNKWSATVRATAGMTAPVIAASLASQIKAKGLSVGITATANAAKVDVSSTVMGDAWKLLPSDDLFGVAVISASIGKMAINDKAYIKDLYRQCIGDRGIYGTDISGLILHKEPVLDSETYVLYTLSFYNSRINKTTKGDDVRQVVHIAVPNAAATITAIDTILTALTTDVVAAP